MSRKETGPTLSVSHPQEVPTKLTIKRGGVAKGEEGAGDRPYGNVIKLSSEEIVDEIAAMSKKENVW